MKFSDKQTHGIILIVIFMWLGFLTVQQVNASEHEFIAKFGDWEVNKFHNEMDRTDMYVTLNHNIGYNSYDKNDWGNFMFKCKNGFCCFHTTHSKWNGRDIVEENISNIRIRVDNNAILQLKWDIDHGKDAWFDGEEGWDLITQMKKGNTMLVEYEYQGVPTLYRYSLKGFTRAINEVLTLGAKK